MIQKAVILSTGDEITTGKVVDTNANYLADKLHEIGIDLAAVITVGDVPDRLEWAWRTGMQLGDVVLSTGGIGPTADDLTTETIARITGRKLFRDDASVETMRRMFATINRVMPENNLKQADFPEGAEVIPNPLGTAPGFHLPVTDAHGDRVSHLIVMPGVPREMKPMMENWVIPWLGKNRGTNKVFAVRIFQTFGISESGLDQAVIGLIKPEEGKVGFRASFPQISMKIAVEGEPGEAERKLEELSARVREKISGYLFAEGEASMEEVVAQLLIKHGLTLGVAESCTGGLIGHRLTNVPGSSKFLLADLVTYSNEMKQELLGVTDATLKAHGAVSEECVREMAAGVRKRVGAEVGIATSGIAGPDGGTPDKPVGTVCIALDSEDVKTSRRYQMRGTRDWVKLLGSQVALDWLRRYALKIPIEESQLFRR
jgi:nicotinamide-nucleotide amidase